MEIENSPTPNPDAQSRRRFLQKSGGAAALAVVGSAGQTATAMDDKGRFERTPFSLGVTSGDHSRSQSSCGPVSPRDRLNEAVGCLTRRSLFSESSPPMTISTKLSNGDRICHPEQAHSVHVEVTDLEPDSEYYYQFKTAEESSSIGRTKTLPAPDATVEEFTFAFASCQAWYTGFYTAYEHMAEDNLDLIIHLGDYDEFGGTNFPLIHAVLRGPHIVPTPRLICDYARNGHMTSTEARTLITTISPHRSWENSSYVAQLLRVFGES